MTAFNRGGATVCVLLLLATASACYRLTPSDGGAPTVGRELVLQLTDRGSIELAPQLGAQLRSVSGRVTEFRENAYLVAVTQTNSRSGIETLWRGEPSSIPRDYVSSIAERRLDKGRTWVAAGLSALGVALVGKAFGIDAIGNVFGSRGGGTRL